MVEFAGLAASSFGLGALHGLEPGHGKTVVAAYLVGTRGRWYHAVHLGIVVTITHTIGIIVLGLLGTYAAEHYAPERVTYWMKLVSAVLIVGIGGCMIWQRSKAVGQHAHHGDHQGYGGELGRHRHKDDAVAGAARGTFWSVTALGISGGLLPCPAALAVLLFAVGTGRIAQGVSLVIIFSLGMACILIAIGLFVVRASQLAQRTFEGARWLRYTPALSAAIVTTLGVVLLVKTLLSGGHAHY